MHFIINTNLGDSIWFIVMRYIIIAIGLLLNIILSLFLSKHKISSATMIIKSSTFTDIILLLTLSLFQIQEEKYFYSTSTTYPFVYCHFLYCNNIFWLCLSININFVVSLAIDRFILITFPFTYRKMKSFKGHYYIMLSILFGFVNGIINTQVYYIEKVHFNNTMNKNLFKFSCKRLNNPFILIFYILTFNLTPPVILFISNIITIRCLLKNAKESKKIKIWVLLSNFTRILTFV